MSREPFRTRYPILFAFDGQHEFLDEAAASGATTGERIKSVWPYLTRQVIAFSKSLKERERVSFDPEDVLAELYVALAVRDHKWSPERGKYSAFAGRIIANELCSIRDRARVVEAPRNSFCRIKEYEREVEAGTITPTRLRTLEDIQRTGHGTAPISGNGRDFDRAIHDDPAAIIAAKEEADEELKGLKSAIERLVPVEADVLVRTAGLFGAEQQSSRVVARAIGRPEWEVTEIKATAMRKIRSYLTAPKRSAA